MRPHDLAMTLQAFAPQSATSPADGSAAARESHYDNRGLFERK